MIEPMDVEHGRSGRIYFETADGQPAFEPAGKCCGIDLDKLRAIVEANRSCIEAFWVTTMCYKGWLPIVWDRALRDRIKIVAYPGMPNERDHELPFRWREIIGDREPRPRNIGMDRGNALLTFGVEERAATRVSLPAVLWP